MEYTIAVDAMSSDNGPEDILAGVFSFISKHSVRIDLFGDADTIKNTIRQNHKDQASKYAERFSIHHTQNTILQTDNPLSALRHKKDSSTHLAVEHVANAHADAVVSCANTGALVAISRYKLKMIKGIERISLMGSFPTYQEDHDVYISDIGATVDAKANHLVQYAELARAYLCSGDAEQKLRVGILNNGVEQIKGNQLTKEASQLLLACESIDFKGYVEGDMLYSGAYDLVVCDGFVGNAVLKSCEGAARFITHTIKQALVSHWLGWIIAYPFKWLIRHFGAKLNPARRNGAIVLGVPKVVIKSHGNSDSVAFENALIIAYKALKNDVTKQLALLAAAKTNKTQTIS